MIIDEGFRVRMAAILRSLANDLKRDEHTADVELGLDEGTFSRLVSGELPMDWALLDRVVATWPVNERDLLPVRSDTDRGVLLFREKQSRASARVLARAGVDYYEYRDTAMSRLASFRPEWIRMRVVVEGDDPLDPALRWNEGHLLYQFTYFVGPVNYYYRSGSVAKCVPMTTGDSVWGRPFVPHTFAARSASEPAYILALTYGVELSGDAQHELSALGPETACRMAVRQAGRPAAATILQSFLDAALMPLAELAHASGVDRVRLEGAVAGAIELKAAEVESVAAALRVPVRELLVPPCDAVDGATVVRRELAPSWRYPSDERPDYVVTRLAGDRFHAHVVGLELSPLRRSADRPAFLTTHQHQYVYCLDGPIRVRWRQGGREFEERLDAGDSIYTEPFVAISYGLADESPATGDARLLVLRVAGKISPGARIALGALEPDAVRRVTREDRRWYRGDDPA